VTKLSAGDIGRAFSLGLLIAQPKSGPPLHRHSREDELFIVTSGRFVSSATVTVMTPNLEA
jgi:mannose-6-phosphate isomerase-like protein (cupin superfamily)